MDGVIAKRAEYLAKADECLRRAANTRDDNIREQFLGLAQHWANMAEELRWLATSVYAVRTRRLKRERPKRPAMEVEQPSQARAETMS